MNNNIHAVLDNILNIIGYQGDKDKFSKDLILVCYLDAVGALIETLPEDKKEAIRKELTEVKEPAKFEQIISNYFDNQQFGSALQKSTEKIFKEYIETIKDTLSGDQLNKLTEYLISSNSQIQQ